MNLELNRLHTFNNWPGSAPVDPARLARGGFFYTGDGTEVQCFSCNGKISQWNYGDQVMWRHRLLEPQCTFVAHPSLSGNISLSNFPISPSWTEEDGGEGQTEADSALPRSTPDYGLTEDDEMYKSDALRLLSFINWEDASVSREALVNAGFYHAGGGRLRCAWCGGELAPYNNLGSLGSPLEIHRMYFPRCDHAATIMASIRSSNFSNSYSPLSDTPPVRSPVHNDNEPQSSGAAHNTRILNAGGTWRALGVVSGGARHPTHSSLASRLATFQRWPTDRTQTPLALAEAGFFHTGTDDQVRCFYCDGGLGKWEPGDAPWSEHARWFPSCGYVLLVKGQEFVDSCEPRPATQRTASSTESRVARRNADLPVTEEQINESMESLVGMGALSAGLDAARVKRAITRRLRTAGIPFATSESLIDAVLDEQLNEEAWSVTTNSQRFARDILAETLQEFIPLHYRRRNNLSDLTDDPTSPSDSTRSPSPSTTERINLAPSQRSTSQNLARSTSQNRSSNQNRPPSRNRSPGRNRSNSQTNPPRDRSASLNRNIKTSEGNKQKSGEKREESEKPKVEKKLSLEEENRQLKESRMCKVCMDSEVSVVFLPCGHLVSCARCGAALSACPLCRASVKALVRAYLA